MTTPNRGQCPDCERASIDNHDFACTKGPGCVERPRHAMTTTPDLSRAAIERLAKQHIELKAALAQAEKKLSCRDALIKDHLTKILFLENRIDVETHRADELDDAVWLCRAGQDDLRKELDAAESALDDEREKVVHYVRGLNAIVNLQSYCTRAAIREFAHDILSGRTKSTQDESPAVAAASIAKAERDAAREENARIRKALEKAKLRMFGWHGSADIIELIDAALTPTEPKP